VKTRREFLIAAPSVLLGAYASALTPLSLTPAFFSRDVRQSTAYQAPPTFADLHFVTADPNYSDYRPAIDASAQHVVFERTPVGGGATKLYILSLASGVPERFVEPELDRSIITGPVQTRPDWSWVTGQVVLDVAASNNSGPRAVLIVHPDGSPIANVPDSKGYVYPTWSPDGTQLIVYNGTVHANPQPCTSLIDLDGTVVTLNLNGTDANGALIFGGFASPTPGNVNLIAYAGQPDIAWGPDTSGGYNQDYNYVFVNTDNNGVFTSAPLESGASITIYDPSHQGRAPVWSPDGNYVAFESDRAGGYAIFLANVATGSAPVQITDASYGAQHPKFYPDQTKVILTAYQKPDGSNPRGIAWVDISGYL
jgi:Tol biopolymer transport system component